MQRFPNISPLFLLISPLAALPFSLVEIYKRQKIGIISFSIILALFASIFLPDFGMDSAKRYILYESFTDKDFDYFFNFYLINRADSIFYTTIFLFAYYGISFQILIFLYSLMNIYIPLKILLSITEKRALKPEAFFLCFLTLLFSISYTMYFSGIRQLSAFVLLIYGYYLISYKGKNLIGLLFVISAPLMHFSMFILAPFIFFAKYFDLRISIITLLLMILILFFIPKDFFFSALLEISSENIGINNKIKSYAFSSVYNPSFLLGLSHLLRDAWFYLLFPFLLYFQKYSSSFKKLIYITIIIIGISAFLSDIAAGRYTSFLKILVALHLIEAFVNKIISGKILFLFIVLFFYQVLFDFLIIMVGSFEYILSPEYLFLFQILSSNINSSDII